jgi:hypothetical protein
MTTERKPLLIGLAGQARTGKDTAGTYLATRYCLRRLAFAEPIKRGIAAMLDEPYAVVAAWPKEAAIDGLDVTPRQLFQTLGTDWGRNLVHPDLWISLLRRQWREIRADPEYGGAVITDVRMPNEAAWIRREGGLVIHVTRDDRPAVRQHVSEDPLPILEGDVSLPNNGTLDELHCRLRDIVDGFRAAQ